MMKARDNQPMAVPVVSHCLSATDNIGYEGLATPIVIRPEAAAAALDRAKTGFLGMTKNMVEKHLASFKSSARMPARALRVQSPAVEAHSTALAGCTNDDFGNHLCRRLLRSEIFSDGVLESAWKAALSPCMPFDCAVSNK